MDSEIKKGLDAIYAEPRGTRKCMRLVLCLRAFSAKLLYMVDKLDTINTPEKYSKL